jgi:hypothetical protein
MSDCLKPTIITPAVPCINNQKSKVSAEVIPVSIDCTSYLLKLPRQPNVLLDETVISALWSADNGVTISMQAIQSPYVYCQLSGGTLGSTATIKCLITTNSGAIKQFKYTCEIV